MQNFFHHQDFLLRDQEVFKLILLKRSLRKVFQNNAIHTKKYSISLRNAFLINTQQEIVICRKNLGEPCSEFRSGLLNWQKLVIYRIKLSTRTKFWNCSIIFRIIMRCYS
ncbi:hypothetical protein GLOIN_2v1613740 [Rhizophagus irregularis DAOM 181602=DAOM 197198]|uniref:Uncharacterized protein n=1 Tax=Rhizophagus irregularis (strain DAOM 181602 / DAOM 197198 / MUCL 43194) TaxID=747089 RepID=A0A2P4PZ84_RHIID|nr:hypothetical protein GLOIN_2v1613740 [Rhizophagus irregularis DAOM 181602=DAOM 197198]POG70689.1 hypothetical protein GLOIN_2v1613740 [Rhizophagus irregularis DAOM 181602=DAOM 197198]|eukprot:XP_025177555.1 hypothetical protein GLOIN_2v1613740 [Rhizophagus irregularis DAOM 181602=DAOM 197198]